MIVVTYNLRRDQIQQRNLELEPCPLCGVLVEFGTMHWHPDPALDSRPYMICEPCWDDIRLEPRFQREQP